MDRTIEIIKALLQLLSQATFQNDVEGARKITIVVQAANAEIVRLEEIPEEIIIEPVPGKVIGPVEENDNE